MGKKEIPPLVVVGAIALAVVLLGLIGYHFMNASPPQEPLPAGIVQAMREHPRQAPAVPTVPGQR